MKKLDFIIIGITILIIGLFGVIAIKKESINKDEINIAIIIKGEEKYSLSLNDEGIYNVECKDSILNIKKDDKILYTQEIDSKDFSNQFEIKNQKVTMLEASCDGKDCTKMYISKNHLIPIICINGLVLNPYGIESETDVNV